MSINFGVYVLFLHFKHEILNLKFLFYIYLTI
ncbi:hypothetical protein FIC_01382 [Flavobacteriaceae bacterium 3519-10]|nr:hypothetical protein FIC_01382 [Flavobacteriaceae bacterium 3519-10]